jgi:hypothetical protein
MTTEELFELLHLARRSYGNATARVRLRRAVDRWGRPAPERATEVSFEADGVFGRHIESGEGHWQQCAFDPNVLIPELWLEPLDETVVAGRRGIRVRGRRRPASHDYFVLPGSADEWELVVDLERGILLRLAAVAEGTPTIVYEITEIVFDSGS